MGFKVLKFKNTIARVFRISFSGELAFEMNVMSDYGEEMWNEIINQGEDFGIQPYGNG